MVDVSRIHQGSYISIFKSLPSREVLHILCVYRALSWSLRGRWRFLRGVLVVFEMLDTTRMHQGSSISIFKSLPSWKVVQHLGSPMVGGDKENVTNPPTNPPTDGIALYIYR